MKEYIERGIDKFEVGQLFVIRFPSMMDENFYIGDSTDIEFNKKKDIENASRLPAIITKKVVKDEYFFPIYSIKFLSRHITGKQSGWIEIGDINLWRFLGGNEHEPIEGIPPKYLLKAIKEDEGNSNYFDFIDNSDLFYVLEDEDGKPYKEYLFDRVV